MKKINYIWALAALAVAAALPLITSDQYFLHISVLILIYVGITVAWNILAFGGILSLGHAAFVGLGGYTVAILYVDLGVNPWIGMLAAMVVAGLGGLFLAIPLLRLRGPFFTLATLAFVEVLRLLAIFWTDLTNGSVGITTPPTQGLAYISFQDREPYYYIVLAMTVIAVAISIWIYYSRLGYHLRASASDEAALRALGVRTSRVKVAALLISAALSGAFGAFAALYFFIVEPSTQFSSTLYSIQPALNGIIGGMGTVLGPIIGAIIMTPLGEWLRTTFSGSAQGLNFVIYGVVLIVIVRMMPGGIVEGFRAIWRRVSKRSKDPGEPDPQSPEEPEAVPVSVGARSQESDADPARVEPTSSMDSARTSRNKRPHTGDSTGGRDS